MKPILALTCAVAAFLPSHASAQPATPYSEPWRPQFHFTPERNWMNDPNGMVFFDGEYHLFYQFNPFGDKWGHMSWGHTVSRDLVHWEHLPVAIPEVLPVMAFSGSAVVDHLNTSGFGEPGKPPLVAIYTGHYTDRPLQNQHIAYSTDRGRTWTSYSGNPVLDIGAKDFRDPKVFWHEPSHRWIMTVAWPVERKIRFYASPNLKQWTHLSDFGPAGSITGIWECPDLFPLPVEGRRTSKPAWVLIVNVGSGAPAGGSGCQYFVGHFDGSHFIPDPRSTPKPDVDHIIQSNTAAPRRTDPALWADFGRDFYAAVSWSDIPATDGRRLWLGWMSNWEYAQDVPTAPWRSAMTVPRELRLRSTRDGLRLVQIPVRELESLRIPGESKSMKRAATSDADAWLGQIQYPEGLADLSVDFQASRKSGRHGISIHTADDEITTLIVDPESGRLLLNRHRSGRTDFHAKFPAIFEAPISLPRGRWNARLLVDTSSIEVFVNDGEAAITSLVFPKAGRGALRFHVFGDVQETRITTSIESHALRSAWR